MTTEEFLNEWQPIEHYLRTIEETYRRDRLRPQGYAYPEGQDKIELRERFHHCCDLYIRSTAEQRETMRAFFGWSYLLPKCLWPFPPGYLERCEKSELRQSIRLALAAVSLENNKTDFRDTLGTLEHIWLSAVGAEIDPEELFKEAAEWSSDQDDFNYKCGTIMRDFLRGFSTSLYFRQSAKLNPNGVADEN